MEIKKKKLKAKMQKEINKGNRRFACNGFLTVDPSAPIFRHTTHHPF